MQQAIRRFVHFIGRPLIRLLIRLEIVGVERIPPGGPVILMSNHINFVDVSIVLVMLPRDPVGFAKRELLRWPIVGWLFWGLGVIPVRRGEVDRGAIREAVELLTDGRRILMIAPEGTRSGHGRLQTARDGLAYIALRAGATVVPCAVSGVEGFWGKLARLRRTRVRIELGEPFRFDLRGRKQDRASLHAMTREAMYRLAGVLPERYRGVYADLENATQDYLTAVDHHIAG